MCDESTIKNPMSGSISTYINPLTDFGFKYIFGRHAEKKFTLSFLNALIDCNVPITDIEFIDKEKKGESKDDRALIYDLHCKLKDDSKIIVEMQNRYQTHFDDRMDKDADECETTLERWMYLLKNMEAIPQSFTKDPIFRDLNKVARYAALTEKDKKAYKESLKAYRDAYAIYETEQAIGEARGIQIGEARGKAEERRNSIRMMLSFGVPANKIAEKYSMTEEEVMRIGESD
ncbi:MAG: Rpn family recombination-promoting nuclease/putative transposase [Muribaculaceae bacterium]|nr:Rpn family recombination-promoting nuclease/putative transposase [Muribaculaceae bacterium]